APGVVAPGPQRAVGAGDRADTGSGGDRRDVAQRELYRDEMVGSRAVVELPVVVGTPGENGPCGRQGQDVVAAVRYRPEAGYGTRGERDPEGSEVTGAEDADVARITAPHEQ